MENKTKAILLKINQSKKIVYINNNINVDTINTDDIKTLYKKKGKGNIERHCSWELDEYIISVFGWKNGKAGKENKTELPPPEDTDIFFGDILAIKSDFTGKVLDLDIETYNEFYELAYGGFESLGSQDTDDDDGDYEESDESFIVDSDEEIEYESGTSKDESEFSLSADETEEDEEEMILESDESSQNSSTSNEEIAGNKSTSSSDESYDETKGQKKDESKTQKQDESKTQKADESKTQKTDESKTQKTDESKTQKTDESKGQKTDESKGQKTDESKK